MLHIVKSNTVIQTTIFKDFDIHVIINIFTKGSTCQYLVQSKINLLEVQRVFVVMEVF